MIADLIFQIAALAVVLLLIRSAFREWFDRSRPAAVGGHRPSPRPTKPPPPPGARSAVRSRDGDVLIFIGSPAAPVPLETAGDAARAALSPYSSAGTSTDAAEPSSAPEPLDGPGDEGGNHAP